MEIGDFNRYIKDCNSRVVKIGDTVLNCETGKEAHVLGFGFSLKSTGELCIYDRKEPNMSDLSKVLMTTLGNVPANKTMLVADTETRLIAEAMKSVGDYWGCTYFDGPAEVQCAVACPAMKNGERPYQQFKVPNCAIAMTVDLMKRGIQDTVNRKVWN